MYSFDNQKLRVSEIRSIYRKLPTEVKTFLKSIAKRLFFSFFYRNFCRVGNEHRSVNNPSCSCFARNKTKG